MAGMTFSNEILANNVSVTGLRVAMIVTKAPLEPWSVEDNNLTYL